MAKPLSEDIATPLKQLIIELSGFQDGSEPFNHILKYFTVKLKKSNTMYFLNKKDIENNIESMSEKFCFHGFFSQASSLKAAFKTYLPDSLPKPEAMNRLNMVKLMLCLSESPTKHFLDHPELSAAQEVEREEEDIDWAAYLNEGVEKWQPNYDDTSDNDSDNSVSGHNSAELMSTNYSIHTQPTQIKSVEKLCVIDLKTNREELLTSIQHSWFNVKQFFMEPESQWREANIGIIWENYLNEQMQGLIPLQSPSIITEYKVIREILWQLWCPHTSCSVELSGSNVRPRPDVTLASIRSYAFYTYMNEFIPYIELLEHFREFEDFVRVDLEHDNPIVCQTFQSYCSCLGNIIRPIYKALCQLEDLVRKQESTYTLIILAKDLKQILAPLKLLKEIHEKVIINSIINTPLNCATSLLIKLHESLDFSMNKLEQDLKLTLFIGSVYHYLNLVDFWLVKDDLVDYTGEFVIEKKVVSDQWHTHFSVRKEVENVCKNNSFLQIFSEKILKIGKNINFLRLLGKYDLIGDYQESIYDEFTKELFEQIYKLNDTKSTELDISQEENWNSDTLTGKQNCESLVKTDTCKFNPEVLKLENLVNVDDGFLMTAFADFFSKEKPEKKVKEDIGLYEKISKATTRLFPKANLIENIFVNIIEQRFTVSGLMVKNLLIEEYLLEKQLTFLRHLYLFYDDMIFPFYRRLFAKTESTNKNWTNNIWLTAHLHDLFTDMYPEFYEKCSVQVKDGWSLCGDPLTACSLINVDYDIPWPLNIIISQEQLNCYKDIFQFLLKLKWALYTVNHLVFSDLESKGKKTQTAFKETNPKNKVTAKLIRLKFCLINILNSLQHFLFGFVFARNLLKFELDFEKAYDLNSLIESHGDFIKSVSGAVEDLQSKMLEKDKTNNIWSCVKMLKIMWNDPRSATLERIQDCNTLYNMFYSDISPVIFPVYIYDY